MIEVVLSFDQLTHVLPFRYFCVCPYSPTVNLESYWTATIFQQPSYTTFSYFFICSSVLALFSFLNENCNLQWYLWADPPPSFFCLLHFSSGTRVVNSFFGFQADTFFLLCRCYLAAFYHFWLFIWEVNCQVRSKYYRNHAFLPFHALKKCVLRNYPLFLIYFCTRFREWTDRWWIFD